MNLCIADLLLEGVGWGGGSIQIPNKIHKQGHCTEKVSHKLNRAESLCVFVNRACTSQLPVVKFFEFEFF